MGKFIQTEIGLKRTPPKPIKDEKTGNILKIEEETLTVTLKYIGYGDTTNITDEQLMDKFIELFETEIS